MWPEVVAPGPMEEVMFSGPPLVTNATGVVAPVEDAVAPEFFGGSFVIVSVLCVVFFLPRVGRWWPSYGGVLKRG